MSNTVTISQGVTIPMLFAPVVMLAGMYKILMVCMGNICRSPIAQAVLYHQALTQGLAKRLMVDSAGTHGQYHAGEAPDPRAQSAAIQRGYSQIAKQRARAVSSEDFETFDLIVAMDHDNLSYLQKICPAQHSAKLKLLLEYAPKLGLDEVLDPYYGDLTGFENTLDLCESGVRGLLLALPREVR
jgi:protein-tyrosine phosphatase